MSRPEAGRAARIRQVLAKDLRLGPRSPLVLWSLVLPVVMTLLIQGVFGSLFDRPPRLGIVDRGGSRVAAALAATDGIEVSLLDDQRVLERRLDSHDLDAGLVLPAGFDAALRAGRRPPLQLQVAAESAAADRLVVAVRTLGVLREAAGQRSPVDVRVTALGEPPLELALRALPLLVVFAVAVAGAMVPAMSLVEEKDQHTLEAVLVTPTAVTEVLAAKAALGVLLASLAGVITLALNDAFGAEPVAVVAAIVIGAVMMAEIGLLLGAWAGDVNTLFAAWKAGAILLVFPVLFYLFPDLPQWIARIGPTYYFLDPVFRLSIEQARLPAVAGDLAVAVAICAALAPAVVLAGGWMERRLGAAAGPAGD